MDDLIEQLTQSQDYTPEQLMQRWSKPFNIVEDLFRLKDFTGQWVKYKPYDYSVEFLENGFKDLNKNRIVLKSRQLGISTIAEIEAVITAMTFEDTEVSFISAQEKSAKKLIDACGTLIKNSPYDLPFSKANIQKEKIKCDTGTSIVAYSSKPDSLRGDNSIKVYLDEFAFLPNQDDMLDAVLPKVSRGGQITYMSTPLASDDLFMNTFRKAQSGELDMYWQYLPMFEEGTYNENVSLLEQPELCPICPDLNLSIVEQVRRSNVSTFLQEYQCIPVDQSNAYYPSRLIMDAIIDDIPSLNMNIYMGIDIALAKDETAIVIVGETDGVYYVLHVETTQAEYKEQLKLIEHLYHTWNPIKIRSDATGTMGIQVERDLKERFGYIVEGITYTNTVKQDMAMRLKMYLQNTSANVTPCIYLSNHKGLISELHNIQIDVTKAGNIIISGKHGGGLDDIVNALWLALPPVIHERLDAPIVNKGVGSVMLSKSTNDSQVDVGFYVHNSGRTKRMRGRR